MEIFYVWLAICRENPSVTAEFPSQRASDMELLMIFVVNLNKLLHKQSSNQWFDMPQRPCDVTLMPMVSLAMTYRKTSNIRSTLVGDKIVDQSDVVGASPVGAAPTTSSFST